MAVNMRCHPLLQPYTTQLLASLDYYPLHSNNFSKQQIYKNKLRPTKTIGDESASHNTLYRIQSKQHLM